MRKKKNTAGQTTVPPAGALLTNSEFCDRLKMSRAWGRKLIQRREVNYVRVGKRCIRIPEAELLRFIERGMVPAVTR